MGEVFIANPEGEWNPDQVRILRFWATAAVIPVLAGGCSLLQARKSEPPLFALHPPKSEPKNADRPGCLSMMDEYCDSLYYPGNDGNLVIYQKKGAPITILQGKKRNGIRQVYYELARSKIRNKEKLPRDFLLILKAHRYFDKLDSLIHHDPFETMTLTDRLEVNEAEHEVEYLWNLAIEDTVILRMASHDPDYFRTPSDLQPPESEHTEKMERKILLSEISKAIWKDHPNWNKVVRTFEALRAKYLTVISKLPIAPALKAAWKERISTITLALPGGTPELVDQECSSTNSNAFYYTYHNVITVCAGDFNSEDILTTLSHEIAHALDNDRDLFLHFKRSEFSRELESFGKQLCSAPSKPVSCESWSAFKKRSMELASGLGDFTPALPALNRCLKKEPGTRPFDEQTIDRFASIASKERIRGLVDEEAFIRLIAQKLPLPNGTRVPNPSHRNPCHYLQSSWDREDVNGELPVLTAFLAEYECSDERDPAEKLGKAISFANVLFTEVESQMIRAEGEFSGRRMLIEEDYSSPPTERFADALGSLVVAEYLKDIQATWDRRMLFLAGNSWQCPGPSLSKEFPTESAVLRKYLLDSHTEGDERRMDLFPEGIRSVLACEQDFEALECDFASPDETP